MASGARHAALRVNGSRDEDVVAKTFPLLDAGKALELRAAGGVEGKIVLEAPS
jgi:hypothetical protein